jgi:hypothetical protein
MPLCHDLITSVLPAKPSPTKTKRRKMPLKITHNSKIYFPSFMYSLLEVKRKQIKGKGHKLSEKMGPEPEPVKMLTSVIWFGRK